MAEVLEVASDLVTGDVTPVTSAETIVATTDEIFVPRPNARIVVEAVCSGVGAANATSVEARVRAGTLIGGTLIGEAFAAACTGAALFAIPILVVDNVGAVDSVRYVITIAVVAATANPTVSRTGWRVTVT